MKPAKRNAGRPVDKRVEQPSVSFDDRWIFAPAPELVAPNPKEVPVLETLTRKFPYVHIVIGLMGNLMFVSGAVLSHPSFISDKILAGYLYIGGSSLMLIGAIGRGLKTIYERREERRETRHDAESRLRRNTGKGGTERPARRRAAAG
ncbi:YrhK family protein [Stakelama tenebrarum]|uniref:YrhK domain-containing protein n=1 Tax=Stakelama tenebrarum TaxID=2711215 RepID=A0A6G6Y513_9SPHN|nr:YrhK family protein [Sphingosinithalassobacter tenebrarum]QIG80022.1 hypothetical protein G5C33_09685 [Sphingosinithalassobacter tenebrarum]